MPNLIPNSPKRSIVQVLENLLQRNVQALSQKETFHRAAQQNQNIGLCFCC